MRLGRTGDIRYPVRLYRSTENRCKHKDGRDRCDGAGIFYGSDHLSSTLLCPRHWYEIHFDFDRRSALLGMTDAEYEEALRKLEREQREAISRVSRQVTQLGLDLARMGMAEEADRLYDASGWLEASGQHPSR